MNKKLLLSLAALISTHATHTMLVRTFSQTTKKPITSPRFQFFTHTEKNIDYELSTAAKELDPDLVKYWLKKGANTGWLNREGDRALLSAITGLDGNTKLKNINDYHKVTAMLLKNQEPSQANRDEMHYALKLMERKNKELHQSIALNKRNVKAYRKTEKMIQEHLQKNDE
jgi:hypothetical protein